MQVAFDDYGWAAGVATDLVLTAPGVWSGVDKLADEDALRAFLDGRGLEGVPSAASLEEVHATRARLRALVDDPDPDRLAAGATELTTAVRGLGLDPGHRWLALVPDAAGPGEVLALVGGVGILGVLAHLGPERFRPCSSDTCSGAFIDTSRPGRRRYCMPGVCGNRINVAAHRARRREGTG